MTENEKASSTSPQAARVPSALGSGLDAEIDRMVARAQAEGLQLTGKEGLLGGLIKQAVESAMNAEMTAHLGYEKHAVAGNGSGNSRNGTIHASVQTNVGPVEVDRPRDRRASSTRWCCRRALAGWASSTTWCCRC